LKDVTFRMCILMEKKSYNLYVLSEALQRDNAILADEYDKVNK
jgi:hypothetical protein